MVWVDPLRAFFVRRAGDELPHLIRPVGHNHDTARALCGTSPDVVWLSVSGEGYLSPRTVCPRCLEEYWRVTEEYRAARN